MQQLMSPCPNPRCTGVVSGEESSCPTCGDQIGPCPVCHLMMSTTIGRCGYCGTRLGERPAAGERGAVPLSPPVEADRQPPPLIIGFEAQRQVVTAAMAEAYRRTAAAEGKMVLATYTLERLRETFLTERDALAVWKALDRELGSAEAAPLRESVMELRKWFTEQLFAQQKLRLGGLFDQNPDAGWREWLRTYAEALARWRVTLCLDLAAAPFPFPKAFRAPHDFGRATILIRQERWTELHHFFIHLAGHDFLHPVTRALLLIPAGQIYLSHFNDREKARELLNEAEGLASGNGRVNAALAEYHLTGNDFEPAKEYCEQAMAAAPSESIGCIIQGDLAEKQGRLDEAIGWFREAIARDPGDTAGYCRLVRIYGKPELFERYESLIAPLAERVEAIDRSDFYQVLLDIGDSYHALKRCEEDHGWYRRAITLDPARIQAHIWEGFAFLEEGSVRYADARTSFSRAVELAPEAYIGFWGLGQLCQTEGKWEEAAQWYAKAAELQPEFRSAMLALMAEMNWKMERFEAAEELLLEALRLDPANDSVILELADEYYQKRNRLADAVRLYGQIREIKGEPYEANYRNLLGNTHFFEGDYENAARHYEAAVAADSRQAVYLRNLAGAYRELKRWPEAREILWKSLEADGNQAKHDAELAHLCNEEANELYGMERYREAIDLYSEAVRLDATLRHHSNRALAWEQLITAGDDPVEAIDMALADISVVLGIAGPEQTDDVVDLRRRQQRLELQRSFIERYGASAIKLLPVVPPLRVYLHDSLLPLIIDKEKAQLSEQFLDAINATRERLYARHGFPIPGIRFTELLEQNVSKNYAIELNGEMVASGRLEAEGQPQEFLLRHVEAVVESNISAVLDHDQVTAMLGECHTDDCREVEKDPSKLDRLTRKLRAHLAQQGTIGELAEHCRELLADWQAITASEPLTEEPAAEASDPSNCSLAIRLGKDSPIDRQQLEEHFTTLRDSLFEEYGVIVPHLTISYDEELPPDQFRAEIGGSRFHVSGVPAADELWIVSSRETAGAFTPVAKPFTVPFWEEPALIIRDTIENRQEIARQGLVVYEPIDFVDGCLAANLREQMALFLTTDLVEYYLARLEERHPALTGVVRHHFSTQALALRLREILSDTGTVRNLPRLLDELLSPPLYR